MSISNSIKNKYDQMKDSLRASIFSKNKSVIRISEFSKKSILNKIVTFTSINMFICIPYFIWFGSLGKLSSWLAFIIPSFALTFLVTNTLFFGFAKILSLLFKKKNTVKEEVPLFVNWKEQTTDLEPARYFGKGFMEKIREFFIAAGSVATTFIPFVILTNILMVFYYLHNQTYFGIDYKFFSHFINYLRIDSTLLVLLTTLTTTSIYGVRFALFLKKVFLRGLAAQKEHNGSTVAPSVPAYNSQKNFPVEEFIPSLSQEFRKNYNINATEELKSASAEIKKD